MTDWVQKQLEYIQGKTGAKYSLTQPRVQRGSPEGGQWTSSGSTSGEVEGMQNAPTLEDADYELSIQSSASDPERFFQRKNIPWVGTSKRTGGEVYGLRDGYGELRLTFDNYDRRVYRLDKINKEDVAFGQQVGI